MRRNERRPLASWALLLGGVVLLAGGCGGPAGKGSSVGLFGKPKRIVENHGVKTDDGWTLALKRFRRNGAPELLGPVVLTHGFSYNGAFWDLDEAHSLARYLADRDFDVWVVSLRGAGASTKPGFSALKSIITTRWADLPATIPRATLDPRKANWTVDDYIDHDVPAIISYVIQATGRPKLFWVGHSMGGMILYAYMERVPDPRVAGLVAVASPMNIPQPPNDLLQGVLKQEGLLKISALAINTTLPAKLTSPLGGAVQTPMDKLFYNRQNMDHLTVTNLFLNVVEDIPQGVLDQFIHLIRTGEFERADGSYNYTKSLGKVTVPVLLVAGAVDNLAPPEVVRFSYDHVASSDKTYRMFGRVNGHKADYGHNDLILGKHSREEVFPLIAQWLTERARPRAPGRP
ncbi:alpha/beta hydrolase [Nitrospinae bacterium AH_259_B05_G02_I21]|nr:alpha/beta hydrolase [Nitrospinae bacterium AH_259_B05_G02_I21]